jgi:2-succinyl-5-enolpyruvyl-6-hydroxy-3-cyclohexene-1-carboxylate synthase
VNLPWAELLLAGLRDAGADHLVVSPGSRSTPLVLAAARLGLPSHVLVDERVAAFFALGRARVTGRPSVLVCTSGTAGAHYLPAVVEAAMARIPLVVITADRPPELHDCAAPQTIDQIHLYGRFARGFCDLGVAEANIGALRAVRRRAAQMAALSRWPDPGPVHINAPARAPLEPAAEPGPDERRMIEMAAAVAAEPLARVAALRAAVADDAIAEVAAACAAARRGLLVAGPAPLARPGEREAVFSLARATGFPLLAEATSQLRWTGQPVPPALCDSFDMALRASHAGRPDPGAPDLAPDLIVELGAPPTSAAWARHVARHRGCKRIVIAPHGWSDPPSGAALLVHGEVGETAGRVAAALPGSAGPGEWSEAWRAADRRARAALERAIDEASRAGAGATSADAAKIDRAADLPPSSGSRSASSGDRASHLPPSSGSRAASSGDRAADLPPSSGSRSASSGDRGRDTSAPMGEHAAVRAVVDALPDGALLVLGNSLPVRVADAACPASARRIDVLGQRGACGIDGLIAGAAGSASAAGRPTAVLLGDVSFAHDLGGLAAARAAGAPLAVVVIDNGGGRIFEQLPVASAPGGAEALERYFLTPPGVDVASAAAAFGLPHRRALDVAALAGAVREALAAEGATVIHAPVAPHGAREVERAALVLLAGDA